MMNLGFFDKTFSDAVSADNPDTPFRIAGANPVSINDVVVVSDVNVHIQRNGNATTTTSPMIPALMPTKVFLYGTNSLSYILADSEGDSGSIWITASTM